nr:MAG TPA_asm: hypothetical protein [Caudoviricetes sp.]
MYIYTKYTIKQHFRNKMFGNLILMYYVCGAKQSDELYHPVEYG